MVGKDTRSQWVISLTRKERLTLRRSHETKPFLERGYVTKQIEFRDGILSFMCRIDEMKGLEAWVVKRANGRLVEF